MQVIRHSVLSSPQFPRSIVTIGNFDGVHLGHQELLGQVLRRAREADAAAVVYTFHPHPLRVINPSYCPPMLTSFEDRLELIRAAGIDAVVWARFDREYAAQDPEVFVRETLGARLQARELWVGPDFVFGRGRAGSIELLRRLGPEVGYRVQVLAPFSVNGELVSSTRIRNAVGAADFATAEFLLGRPYVLRGPVVHGAGRGRGLGFPTANILPREDCLPPLGVYAAWVVDGEELHPAAVNIGPNPTFGGTEISVEAYLLDYGGDLYGKNLELRFVARVRGEIAFRRPEDLVEQVGLDVAQVRRLLQSQTGLATGTDPRP